MGVYDDAQSQLIKSIVEGRRDVSNRETLGPMVPIQLFQALRIVGMGTALEEMVGGGARTIVYQSGQRLGDILGNALKPSSGGDLGVYVKAVHDLCRELRIGTVSAEKVDLASGVLVLRVDECVSCAGIEKAKVPICHFEAGMVAGIVRTFVDKPVKAMETRCHAVGDDACAVEVKILG
ncbi:MAG: V4R domain-containing protein [Polyangiaceae bacterium]